MKRLRSSLAIGVVATIISCGGSSVSSNESLSSSAPSSSSITTPATVAEGSANSDVTTLPPVTVGVDPANLLIDSSLDIAAIDGPVVLWFWAPG